MSLLVDEAPSPTGLSPLRVHAMRGGYLVMAVGLTLVKWPLLPEAHAMPLHEGVTLSLLTATSLLAWLGVWRPIAMLPVLVFEVLWKTLWFSLVALPRAVSGDMGQPFVEVAVNSAVVVVVVAAVPWRHAWRTYVRPLR